MSDEFLGTWSGTKTCGESKGFDEYCKEMKTENDVIETFRKVTIGLKYSRKDDGQLEVCVLSDGQNIKTTAFKSGEEFESQGFDDKTYKIVTTVNGNNSEETSIPVDGFHKGTKTLRTIKDGIMHVKSFSIANPSVTMEYTMTKT
ncbi:uncharacterized protein LOC117336442 [Pecten maximus]|uniref:uncharacterized protein LOC117336442 n=1 Tax=Pecten maximus TaxID=6579 RepID=UPI0014591550|nr:uncharacterized protein LOC117336442 [Pecten maximus]